MQGDASIDGSVELESLSAEQKLTYLEEMDETQFIRDVVRPLFRRLGYSEMAATDNDAELLYSIADPLGNTDTVIVRAAAGRYNRTPVNRDALETLTSGLRITQATLSRLISKEPSKFIVCAAGRVSESARKDIERDAGARSLVLLDGPHVVTLLDAHIPEVWLGVGSDVLPYFRALRAKIAADSDLLAALPTAGEAALQNAATDEMFAPLTLYRTGSRAPVARSRKRKKGHAPTETFVDRSTVQGLISRESRLILVVGEAGSGKTTALKRIAYEVARQAFKKGHRFLIPVYLRALECSEKPDTSLVDHACHIIAGVLGQQAPCFDDNDLQNGRLLLLIDGFDELKDTQSRDAFLMMVHRFNEQYPKCQVILTSREYSFIATSPLLQRFAEFRIGALSLRQAEKIVNSLTRKSALPVPATKELLRQLQDVHGMELNPLFVTIFVATSDATRSDIPANITELFKKYTEMMLGRWDKTKGIAQQYQGPLKDFILQQIALQMHLERQTGIARDVLERRIAHLLEARGLSADIPEITDELIFRSGLFRASDGLLEFRHLMIQEFFAGRGISDVSFLRDAAMDDWWRRAIGFYFGENPSEARELLTVLAHLSAQAPADVMTGISAIGLGLQACYLAELPDRAAVFVEMLKALKRIKEPLFSSHPFIAKYPLLGFIWYYLYLKDSLALGSLPQIADAVLESVYAESDLSLLAENDDVPLFWTIAGLLEAGKYEDARKYLAKFRPDDERFLLTLHMAGTLAENLRTLTEQESVALARILEVLRPRVQAIRGRLMREFRTEMMEIRKGKIVGIDDDGDEIDVEVDSDGRDEV